MDKLGKREQRPGVFNSMIYAKLLKQAESYLHKGEDVLVEATFFKSPLRKPYSQLAKKYRKKIFWIYVSASEESILKQLADKTRFSEADLESFLAVREIFEPLSEKHLILESDEYSMEEMMQIAKNYLSTERDRVGSVYS